MGLIHALRGAVASGDAPAASELYRVVAGPLATKTISCGQDQVAKIKGWLATQP